MYYQNKSCIYTIKCNKNETVSNFAADNLSILYLLMIYNLGTAVHTEINFKRINQKKFFLYRNEKHKCENVNSWFRFCKQLKKSTVLYTYNKCCIYVPANAVIDDLRLSLFIFSVKVSNFFKLPPLSIHRFFKII